MKLFKFTLTKKTKFPYNFGPKLYDKICCLCVSLKNKYTIAFFVVTFVMVIILFLNKNLFLSSWDNLAQVVYFILFLVLIKILFFPYILLIPNYQ